MQNNTIKKPVKLVETIFDVLYLSTVLISGILLLFINEPRSNGWLFGIMALILGLGDSFHLIPRINSMWSTKKKDFTVSLGIGKLITSITMTIFYVVLWEFGVSYYHSTIPGYITNVIYILALLRILLSLLPQNQWVSDTPSWKWGIWRNIPFFLLGMIVMFLYTTDPFTKGGGLSQLWFAILISFICYLPVVLFAHTNRKVGMLMLPKSCAYVAIILMGFSL